jgi:hypothetical protein
MRWTCVRDANGRDCNWVLARSLGRIVPGWAGSWGEYQHRYHISPTCAKIIVMIFRVQTRCILVHAHTVTVVYHVTIIQ